MTIATRRTILVPYTDHLESDFLMLNVCAKNRKYMNGPHTLSSARALFQRVLNDTLIHAMAVLDIRSREYLGHVFVSKEEKTTSGELGYIFDKLYWNRGIASEVLKAFIESVKTEMGLDALTANVDKGHTPSIRLVEKLGFEHHGIERDEFGAYHKYRLTFDEVVYENSEYKSLSLPTYLDNNHLPELKTQNHK